MKKFICGLFFYVGVSISIGFKMDFETQTKDLLKLEQNEIWSYMPLVDGSFRLISVAEAKSEYDKSSVNMARSGQIPVGFYLYTRQNRNGEMIYLNDRNSLIKSHFNPSFRTKFITHGWRNNLNSSVNILIRDAFLLQDDYNIFVVDWSSAAQTINYYSARYSVEEVGKQIAKYIDFLQDSGKMSLKNLQLIGHSLGAHCSGYAGKYVTSGIINSIIGLDPAGPLFSYSKPDERLSQTDARYVETIQTNGGLLGFLQPIGEAAFYPNWGVKQPGCGMDVSGICSHRRSYILFAESIIDNSFISTKCKTFDNFMEQNCNISHQKILMANPLNIIKANGIYYVPTEAQKSLDESSNSSWMDTIMSGFKKLF